MYTTRGIRFKSVNEIIQEASLLISQENNKIRRKNARNEGRSKENRSEDS